MIDPNDQTGPAAGIVAAPEPAHRDPHDPLTWHLPPRPVTHDEARATLSFAGTYSWSPPRRDHLGRYIAQQQAHDAAREALERRAEEAEREREAAEEEATAALAMVGRQTLALDAARAELATVLHRAQGSVDRVREALTATLDCGHPAACAVADDQRAEGEPVRAHCRDVASYRADAERARKEARAAYETRDRYARALSVHEPPAPDPLAPDLLGECGGGDACTVITPTPNDFADLRANASTQLITPPAAQPATPIALDINRLHGAKADLPATPCDDGNPCTKEDEP